MSEVRLAIVGSTEFHGDFEGQMWATKIITNAIGRYRPSVIISGGAIGIDYLAKKLADHLEIPLIEHLPENSRWAPAGFKARNILIANDCTDLVCIRHHRSKTYGSGWTADRSEELGKVVERHFYNP